MAKPPVMAIAHRGASAYAPENTVAAFDEALRLGAPAVEFDVRMSADGIPVVIHDDTVNRTTNGKGRVLDLSGMDLRRLDAGSWKHHRFAGTRIPTLDETLFAIAGLAFAVIELKETISPQLLVELLQRHNMASKTVVISYDPALLAPFKPVLPGLKLGLLSDRWTADLPDRCRRIGAEILVLNTQCLAIDCVLASQALGRIVWCFTVNDPGMVAAAAAMGVEGIITDYPDLIRSRG